MKRCFISSSRSAGSRSSSTDMGCTPLSERLWETRFSQIDWNRSISKVSTFMTDSPLRSRRSGQARPKILLRDLVQGRAWKLVHDDHLPRHLEVGQVAAAGGQDTVGEVGLHAAGDHERGRHLAEEVV